MIKATNKATGEVIELEDNSLDQVIEAWRVAQEYEKAAKSLKDQLKQSLTRYINDNGKSDEYSGYRFTSYMVQRMTYDKSTLKETIDDQDLLDLMLAPDKQFIDKWLKDNVETSGEVGTRLRNSMVEVGKPYEVIKLEKVVRDDN